MLSGSASLDLPTSAAPTGTASSAVATAPADAIQPGSSRRNSDGVLTILERSAAFLAENKKREGVKTLASGLQYKVLREGKGSTPKATDSVITHYRGKLLDGTEFDSSYSRGKPATFPVKGVIAGWTEALQLMKEGDKWQLYIPADLAYGARGAGNDIPPNAVLIFDIELLKVLPNAATAPADAIQPGSSWRNNSDDVLTIVERNGDTFCARFEHRKAFIRELSGHVRGNQISWLAKDVRAVRGGQGGDNVGTIVGDKIDLTWDNNDGKGVHSGVTLSQVK